RGGKASGPAVDAGPRLRDFLPARVHPLSFRRASLWRDEAPLSAATAGAARRPLPPVGRGARSWRRRARGHAGTVPARARRQLPLAASHLRAPAVPRAAAARELRHGLGHILLLRARARAPMGAAGAAGAGGGCTTQIDLVKML